MKQIHYGRKGQLELPAIIPLFLAIAAFVVVFLVIFFLISTIRGFSEQPVGSIDTKVREDTKRIDADYALMQFLRTTVEVDGQRGIMAEIIGKHAKDTKKLEKVFGETAESVMSPSFLHTDEYPGYENEYKTAGWEGATPWSLTVIDQGKEGVYYGNRRCYPSMPVFITEAAVPAFEGGNIIVRLCVTQSYMQT